MRLWLLIVVIWSFSFDSIAQEQVRIGSKLFTESLILGEIANQIAISEGLETEFFEQLGSTRIVWTALQEGEIDIYPDYTGTLIQEILQADDIEGFDELRVKLNEMGLEITDPLGFNNTYAIGVRRKQAIELGIETISDLQNHPQLNYGFGNEFIDRADGWPGLKVAYDLNPNSVTTLEHELAYRGLDAGSIDVIDLYSTDAEIKYYDIYSLEDDLNYFPTYEAVYVYRKDLEQTHPEFINKINQLAGSIDEALMVEMNAKAKLDQMDISLVASEFLFQSLSLETEIQVDSFWTRLLKNTLDHLYLVSISLGLAILLGIPLGILAVKVKAIESAIIGGVGILQTIPSLALLVFMIPLFGIGALPAMAALFLYSLLPIVRNTHSGIKGISVPIRESALALGLPSGKILYKIELPLAASTILTGIKISAVINVGTATLGALIGAGGYGQPILQGIRLDSVPLILEGAIPAALLAILVQLIFDLIEKKQFSYQ